MSESIHNCSVAYTKGVRASGTNMQCPYGNTKLQLKHWWIAGYDDQLNKNVDQDMIIKVSN